MNEVHITWPLTIQFGCILNRTRIQNNAPVIVIELVRRNRFPDFGKGQSNTNYETEGRENENTKAHFTWIETRANARDDYAIVKDNNCAISPGMA